MPDKETKVDPNVLLETVQNQLLKTSGMVSSSQTGIQEAIGAAITGQQKAGEATTERIESQFGREIGFQREQLGQQRTGVLESRRGFATNTAALRQLDERTEKSLRDLEDRKQEALLSNDATTAQSIGQLQIQAIQFQMQAEQNAFSNLLGISQLAVLAQGEERLATSELVSQSQDRIKFLRENQSLKFLDNESKRALEKDALLPEGVLDNIGDLSPEAELRVVGNSLISVNPGTNETKVLFVDSSGKIDVGGVGISLSAASLINGLQNISDLTPSERQSAVNDLNEIGYASEVPPTWFTTKLEKSRQMSLRPDFVSDEWNKHRLETTRGKQFLTKEFLSTIFSPKEIKSEAKKAGIKESDYLNSLEQTIQAYRSIGMSDADILKLMQK